MSAANRSGSAAATICSSGSSTSSSGSSHRNPKLLDSYHGFAMQIFGSNHLQDIELYFLQAVQNDDVETVENLLNRRSHEIFNIDVKDKETGNTPIIWAAKLGHLKIAQLLLKFGADITLRNYNSQTALNIARPNVLKPLVDSVEKNGCSPRLLLQAAWQGNVGVVQRLLREKRILDINCCNVEGFTPLLLVTRDVDVFEKLQPTLQNYNPLAVIDELLRHRADTTAKDLEGKTALHYAASGHTKTAEEIAFTLIQELPLLEVRDNRSLTPMHSASQNGLVPVVVALLVGGADVNAKGFAGSTPLHVSACNGHYQVATTLLDHGADITLVDDSGNTAVDVAKTKKLKTTLRDAWTEATQSKQEVVLGPVKPPSRIGDAMSDDNSPRDDVSPREKNMLRKFRDAHKAIQAEEQMLKDIESGKFTKGTNTKKRNYPSSSSRNCKSSMKTPIPPRTPRVCEKKKPRSLDKTQAPKRSSFSKGYSSGDENKGQWVRGHTKLSYTCPDPTGRTGTSDVNQVPLTVVGLDLDESLQNIRLQRLVTGPMGPLMEKQYQNNQDKCGQSRLSQLPNDHLYQPPPTVALVIPSVTDVTYACNEYMKKGRKLGTSKMSAGTDDNDNTVSWSNAKKKSPRKTHLLNLDQMHLRLNTPSPMSDRIHMFPNSRCILPQSPGMMSGEYLTEETIFEFENENNGMLNSSKSSRLFGSTKPVFINSNSHALRISQTVQRTRKVSGESSSPENSQEHSDKLKVCVIQPTTFNIELSRVNLLKESSDSGQGSSRSTASQGSSLSNYSTPSPLLNPEHESLVKVSVKNRLGIDMTPAATRVQENTRFYSKVRNPYLRTEEVRNHRCELNKSVQLTSTMAVSSVHQLGTIPIEKQSDLQPLVTKNVVGRCDTISEHPRTCSANSKITLAGKLNLKSKIQSGKTSGDIGSSISRPSVEVTRCLSASHHHPSADAGTTKIKFKEDPKNKSSILSDVRIRSPLKESTNKDINKCLEESEQNNCREKENVQGTSGAITTSNKCIDSEEIVTSDQILQTSKDIPTDSDSKELASRTLLCDGKPDIIGKSSLLKEESKISVPSPTNGNVEDKTKIVAVHDTGKTIVMQTAKGASGCTMQKPVNATSCHVMKTKPTSQCVGTKINRNVCKRNQQTANSAITRRNDSSSQIMLDDLTFKPVTKDPIPKDPITEDPIPKSVQSCPKNDDNSKSDDDERQLEILSKATQNIPSRLSSKVNKPIMMLTPREKQGIVVKTTARKVDAAAPGINKELKGPNKTISPSSRKTETAKSSLTDSAPGPNVSKGKPSMSKSFSSNEKSGIEVDVKRAKKELIQDTHISLVASSKTTVIKLDANNQLINSNPSSKQVEVVINTQNEGNTSKNEVVNKMDLVTSSTSTKTSGKKTVCGTRQLRKNATDDNVRLETNSKKRPEDATNDNVRLETNSKKRPEDSKISAKYKNNRNQKENIKKQKVNDVNSNTMDVQESCKSEEVRSNRMSVDDEGLSDAESIEDAEEMLDSVTFVSDVVREFGNVVHIDIKTQEEMVADEPKKVEKKEKVQNRTKIQSKSPMKTDGKSKMAVNNSSKSKTRKVAVIYEKPPSVKSTVLAASKSNKISVSAKAVKKPAVKRQLKNGSKSAGQKPVCKSGQANLAGKHTLSMETLLETSPSKKTIAENTPVITDIMDVIKTFNKGITPTPWPQTLPVEELSSPRKKSPKRSEILKNRAKISSDKVRSGSKGIRQSSGKLRNPNTTCNKSVSKQCIGNASKDGFATVSTKKGKQTKISKEKMKDLHLLSESERQTTAFITGHGWQIKTDRNETENVIICNPFDSLSDDSDVDMLNESLNLSPHHTRKLEKLAIPTLNSDVINDFANIMNPLEFNAPQYLPGTMDTIKEFADSLKSNESGDASLRKIPEESNNNVNTSGEKILVCSEMPPELPPKQSPCERSQSDFLSNDTIDILPKLSALISKEPVVPPALPLKQSDFSAHETLDQTEYNMPCELPPQPLQRTNNSLDALVREAPVTEEQRIDDDSAEDYSDSSCKTNPELLKVFHKTNHNAMQDSSTSPVSLKNNAKEKAGYIAVSNLKTGLQDGEKDVANLAPLPNHNNQSKLSDKGEPGLNQLNEVIHVDDVTNKPPLPKKSYRRKPLLNRIKSEPAFFCNSSECEENDDMNMDQHKLQKHEHSTSFPVAVSKSTRDICSPRTARDTKKRTENTSLAKYIREMQVSGQMMHETHKLEDLKELDEEDLIRKEQLLSEHIQDMTISALQEFDSLLSPTGEGVEITSSPIQPPFTTRESNDFIGDAAGESDLFNRSLAMSEVSEISAIRTEDGDTLVTERHSTGSVGSRGLSGSSLMSSERSHSSNTTTSEPEGEMLHWKKGNLLGRGAFGTVYCGLTSVGQLIAVKQVKLSEKDKDKSRKQYEKLQEEVTLLKTLRHRNIVGFLGCCLEGSSVNIFMQFIPGGSIASLLARFGALDEPVFCRYTKMILDGTEYFHANNVIHRDIKGANIMLMSNGVIKLIDFGCAKRLFINLSQSQNLLKSMRGTPYWMAPEVILETGHGKKSDIWSVGCTVFEMACRKPPWSDMPPMPAIFAIGSGEHVPQLPDKFTPDARDFVNACLTRDQNERPSATDLLSHSFIKNRRERFSEHFHHISGSSLEDSQITFKEQPTNRGDTAVQILFR